MPLATLAVGGGQIKLPKIDIIMSGESPTISSMLVHDVKDP